MTSNEITVESIWRGRHADNAGRYLRVLEVRGEQLCVQHQTGRRVMAKVDKFTSRYEPAGEAGKNIRFADAEPLVPSMSGTVVEAGVPPTGAATVDPKATLERLLADPIARARFNGATSAQIREAAKAAGPEVAAFAERFEAAGRREPAHSQPGMVILSRETGERVQRVAATLQERLKGTGARVSVETLLDDTLSEEWAARLEGKVSP
jgi:hypothetical protein